MEGGREGGRGGDKNEKKNRSKRMGTTSAKRTKREVYVCVRERDRRSVRVCVRERERNGANGIKIKVIELPETQINTDSIDQRLKQ